MDSKVRKVGSTLYLHIPRPTIESYHVEEGDVWEVHLVRRLSQVEGGKTKHGKRR